MVLETRKLEELLKGHVNSVYCPSIERETIIFLKKVIEMYDEPGFEFVYYCSRVDECKDMDCLFRRSVEIYDKK